MLGLARSLVGEKIADCVLLFAYEQHAAFPVDVWIERVLRKLYFAGKSHLAKKVPLVLLAIARRECQSSRVKIDAWRMESSIVRWISYAPHDASPMETL